jgi:hypothetical protein
MELRDFFKHGSEIMVCPGEKGINSKKKLLIMVVANLICVYFLVLNYFYYPIFRTLLFI